MGVFSGRINIQLMYESYGGQHQFPTQGFLMAFSEYIGIQDTETGHRRVQAQREEFPENVSASERPRDKSWYGNVEVYSLITLW